MSDNVDIDNNTEQMLTKKEVAKLLKCSTQTIQRRIDDKTFVAHKEISATGQEYWLLPAKQFNKAMSTIDTYQVDRRMTAADFDQIMTRTVNLVTNRMESQIQAINEKMDKLTTENQQLKQQLESNQEKLISEITEGVRSQISEVDLKLSAWREEQKHEQEQQEQKKGFFRRFFS